MATPVPGTRDLYLIDTRMMNRSRDTAAFFLDADRPVLIDAGSSLNTETVRESIRQIGRDPASIHTLVVSHVHLDHAGGIGFLLEECPRARVVCHERAVPYLTDPEKQSHLLRSVRRAAGENAELFGTARLIPRDRIETVEERTTLHQGSHRLELIPSPGHAPHHLSLHEPDSSTLLLIDEGGAYRDGEEIVTTPPPNFDLEATLRSFDRFRTLDPDRILYSHFGINPRGTPALDDHERVLRDWVDKIAGLREELADRDAVLDQVRQRYDRWGKPVVQYLLERDALGVLLYLEQRDQPGRTSESDEDGS